MHLYVPNVWWPTVTVAMVRVKLGHLQRLACVYVIMAPIASLSGGG